VAAPSGRFLYVGNTASHDLLVFSIDPNSGGLTLVQETDATANTIPIRLALNPTGSFLYVVEDGTAIQIFSVNASTGALSPAGSVALSGRNVGPLTFTSDGKFLYVLNIYGNSRTIAAYAVDPASGALTAGVPVTLPGNVQTMTIDPLDRFLYFTDDSADPFRSTITVESYSIDSSSGALVSTGQSIQVSNDGAALAADPTGKFLYVLGNLNNGIYQNNVIALSVMASTGALSQIGSLVRVGNDPASILCDPSGKFVFTGNAGPDGPSANWNDVTAFSIGQGGATAGQVTQSGQGAMFPYSSGGVGAIAIIE
jgi:6-phosphogluconolactonase (cycloisomerase 2 family)